MLAKVILSLVIIGMLVLSSWFLYQNIPGEPVTLRGNFSSVNNMQINEVSMFYPNLRFRDNKISYYIDSSCSDLRRDKIIEALSIISDRTGSLSFYISNEESAEILAGCSRDYISPEENVFVAGEGGPTKIINTTNFNVILKGKIMLYKESDKTCKEPIIELHELLHVFGFDHSLDSSNILYAYSSCNQKLKSETILTLQKLYSVKSLPDLFFSSVNATKKGVYLDFEAQIVNDGLKDAENISIIISADGEKVYSADIGDIVIGGGRILSVKNAKLPERGTSSVVFSINSNEDEIDLQNNVAYLSVE